MAWSHVTVHVSVQHAPRWAMAEIRRYICDSEACPLKRLNLNLNPYSPPHSLLFIHMKASKFLQLLKIFSLFGSNSPESGSTDLNVSRHSFSSSSSSFNRVCLSSFLFSLSKVRSASITLRDCLSLAWQRDVASFSCILCASVSSCTCTRCALNYQHFHCN